MKNKIICDTGVISRFLTREERIVEQIEKIGIENICISMVSRIELLNWLSNYKNLDIGKRKIYSKAIKNLYYLPLNQEISKIATELSDKNVNSKVADTLIGATTIYHQTKLYTINEKDFKSIKVPLY